MLKFIHVLALFIPKVTSISLEYNYRYLLKVKVTETCSLPFTKTEKPAADHHTGFASTAFHQAVKELGIKLLSLSTVT